MSHYLSSFPIDLPDVTAKVYEIGAELSDEAYSQLAHMENVLEDNTGGTASRIRQSGGEWHVAVFGHDDEPKTVDVDGITLELLAKTTLDPEIPRHRPVLGQALRDSFSSYVTSVLDWWEYNEKGHFYEAEPVDAVRGEETTFEQYRGVRTSFDYRSGSGFMLSMDPTRKFLDERTLADLLDRNDHRSVLDEHGDGRTFFFFDRPAPQPVRLHAISDATVSDETMDIGEEPVSVLTYVEENYGSEYAGKIDPGEPVAKIKYHSDGEPYDAAPSLLRPITSQEEATTQASVLDPRERWSETREWIEPIHYLQLGGERADVASEPIREDIDVFEFPPLRFGNGAVLEVGTAHDAGSGQVSRDSWEYAVSDYLEEFGPAKKPLDDPWIAILYADSTRETAFEAFETLREYVERYAKIDLKDRPGGANFDDRAEFDQWKEEFSDSVTGALAYLTGDADRDYYDVINAVDGKPVQHLRHDNYQSERHRDHSYSLENTATDLASKLGVRPFLLDDGLHADLVIGLSVTGDEHTTACSVTVSGETGDVIDWTDRPHGRGQSTVSNHDLAQDIVQDGVVAAVDDDVGPIGSIEIHRNGTYGNEEIAGIESAIDALVSDGYLEEGVSWNAVELRDRTSYRMYSESGDRACQTGAYARIDDSNVLVAPTGGQFTYDGTPKAFQVTERAGTGDLEILDVGKDVFDLSFLVWWSPGSKIGEPITTRYPSEMHDKFENCPRLQFLPS